MSDFENDDFDRRPIAHIVLLKFSSEKEFLSERTQGRPQKFAPEGGGAQTFFTIIHRLKCCSFFMVVRNHVFTLIMDSFPPPYENRLKFHFGSNHTIEVVNFLKLIDY